MAADETINQEEENEDEQDEPEVIEDTLDLIEIPVRLKKSGKVKDYILKELDGPGQAKYIDFMNKRTKHVGGQPAGIKRFEGIQEKLISMTLWDVEARRFVTMAEAEELNPRIKLKLWTRSARLSGITPDAEGQAKNG